MHLPTSFEQSLSLTLELKPVVAETLDLLGLLLGQLYLVLGQEGEGLLHQVDLHVHVDLLVPDLLLGLHDDADVVQVSDLAVQLAVKVEDLQCAREKGRKWVLI